MLNKMNHLLWTESLIRIYCLFGTTRKFHSNFILGRLLEVLLHFVVGIFLRVLGLHVLQSVPCRPIVLGTEVTGVSDAQVNVHVNPEMIGAFEFLSTNGTALQFWDFVLPLLVSPHVLGCH